MQQKVWMDLHFAMEGAQLANQSNHAAMIKYYCETAFKGSGAQVS